MVMTLSLGSIVTLSCIPTGLPRESVSATCPQRPSRWCLERNGARMMVVGTRTVAWSGVALKPTLTVSPGW